ncbi:hypothetical protein D3C84_904800 [compost metagenome]
MRHVEPDRVRAAGVELRVTIYNLNAGALEMGRFDFLFQALLKQKVSGGAFVRGVITLVWEVFLPPWLSVAQHRCRRTAW